MLSVAQDRLILEDRRVDPLHHTLDRGIFQRLGDARLNRLLTDFALKLLAHVVDGGGFRDAGFHQLHDMEAVAGFDGTGERAFFHRGHGLCEGFDHVGQLEPAQIAAIGGCAIARLGLGDFGEIGACLDLVLNRLSLFLCLHEDMGGVVFARFYARIFRLIGLHHGLLGHGAFGGIGKKRVRQIGAALYFERNRITLGHAVLADLGQCGLLDQLLQNAIEEHVIGQCAVFGRQPAAQGQHMTQGNLGAIDRRHHGIRTRPFGHRCARQCQNDRACTQNPINFRHQSHSLRAAAPRGVDTLTVAPYIAKGPVKAIPPFFR